MSAVGWGGILGWGQDGWGFEAYQADAQAPYALAFAWLQPAMAASSVALPGKYDFTLAWPAATAFWVSPAAIRTARVLTETRTARVGNDTRTARVAR